MRTRRTVSNPRLGAALALAFATPLALVSAFAPAQAAPEPRSATAELSSVRVHTWVETPGIHTASAPKLTGTWIDGIHGPVLDGALLSTPTFVALLLGLAVVAVIMAGRASRSGGRRPAGSVLTHAASPIPADARASDPGLASIASPTDAARTYTGEGR